MSTTPRIRQIVIDTTDARRLAEFYRELFDLTYRDGDEPPPPGEPDPNGEDWLVLRNADGPQLAFQQVGELPTPTWPTSGVPQQLHLDTTVDDIDALVAARDRAIGLGATLRFDRSDHPEEPLYVFADPMGHPFCIFVG